MQEKDKVLKQENYEITQEKNIAVSSSKEYEEQIKYHQKMLEKLKREVGHKKKTLSTYEYLLKQPATMSYMNRAINKDKAVRCPKCSKMCTSHEYYVKHDERRHAIRPSTAPVFDLENIKGSLETQIKEIQENQEKELAEFKKILSDQLLSLKTTKTQEINVEASKPKDLQNISNQIELQRKELILIKYKQSQQQEILRNKEDEIFRLEMENKRLAESKQKMQKKALMLRSSDSRGTRKQTNPDETYNSQEEFNSKPTSKIRTESGETNLAAVMNDLIADKPEAYRTERVKEIEIFKNQALAQYSERMSPSFKGLEDPNEYILPLDSPKPQNIIEAAKVLGIDPVKETQLLYLATEFLKSPIPKA